MERLGARTRLSLLLGPARRISPSQAAPSVPWRRIPVSLLQTITGRGSNLAVKAEPSEESWEEF